MVTLRFPDADIQSWGINFMRDIRRKNEQVFWAPIPQEFSLTRVSLAGSLTDLQSLDRGMDLRIKPFMTGGGRYQHRSVGNTARTRAASSSFGSAPSAMAGMRSRRSVASERHATSRTVG